MRPFDVTVVVPCYNEAKNLPELAARLQRVFVRKKLLGEIVLVDDGSRDATGDVIRDLERRHPNVVGRYHEVNRGMEAGWNTGVRAARGEYVCFIDADLQYQPEDVWRLYREIRLTRADLVQGYRSSLGRLKDSRYLLSAGLNLLLNLAFGMRLRDNKSGFVIGLRDTVAHVLQHRYAYRYFQSLITVSAKAKGYSIREVETVFESRLLGESFIPRFPLKVVTGCLLDIAQGLLEFRLGHGDEGGLGDFLEAPTSAPAALAPRAPLRGWPALWRSGFEHLMPLLAAPLGRRAAREARLLMRTAALTPEQVQVLQERKLRRLAHHLYHHVGYYREVFDGRGLKPGDLASLKDLARLPTLDRGELRDNLHFDLLADRGDKRRLVRLTLCGQRGEPGVVYVEPRQLDRRWAAWERARAWAGLDTGARRARLQRRQLGQERAAHLRATLQALAERVLVLDVTRLDAAHARWLIARLRQARLALLEGDTESLLFLSRQAPLPVAGGLGLRGLLVTGQTLDAAARRALESAFAAPAFNAYASQEFGLLAHECPAHNGLHVVAENHVLELLRDDGGVARPGETGHVVVTALDAFSMPLVRYRLGDRAVAADPREPCPCGSGLPRLLAVEGRAPRLFETSQGAFVAAGRVGELLEEHDFLIRRFELEAPAPGRLRLRITRAPRFDAEAFEHLLRHLRAQLGPGLDVEVELHP
jgi:phenylacetate-CoA ligase